MLRVSSVCKAVAKRLTAEETAAVEALAESLRPKMRAEFLRAVELIGEKVDWKAVERFLAEGRADLAIAEVMTVADRGAYVGLAEVAQHGLILAGQSAATQVLAAAPDALDVRFNAVNPAVSRFLSTYQADLVTGLTQTVRDAISQSVIDGVNAGQNPLTIARDIKAVIGLTPKQEQSVRNFRRYLELGDSTALDRALRDKRFDATVIRAIRDETGLKPDQIDRMVERYRERMLKYRAETIARTEAMRAVSSGQHLMWQQAVADGLIEEKQIRRKWIYRDDSRVRHAHRTIPTLNPKGVGLNETFQSELGPIRFPHDPQALPENTINCRCAVVTRVIPSWLAERL